MRILVIGMLSTALVGCNCLIPQQASVEGFGRLAGADPPAELEPAPFTASPATAKRGGQANETSQANDRSCEVGKTVIRSARQ